MKKPQALLPPHPTLLMLSFEDSWIQQLLLDHSICNSAGAELLIYEQSRVYKKPLTIGNMEE